MLRDLLRGSRAGIRHAVSAMLAMFVMLGSPPAGWALGMGEIELDSALNEKLSARIELFDTEGLQPTEVLVSLASPEDYERLGVERFHFLTDLRFEVTYSGGEVDGVQVTTSQPVTEPYLNFLVEMLWPQGRLLKEYTLLLDPPTFTSAAPARVETPLTGAAEERATGRIDRAPRQSREGPDGGTAVPSGTRVAITAEAPSGAAEEPEVADGYYRMTDRADTLWAIAARTRPSRQVSTLQNMLAIQQLNPRAFVDGNINLLKAGYRLRLPTEEEALSLSAAEAARQVAMQNADWNALRRGEPRPAAPQEAEQPTLQTRIDATPAAAGAPAPAAAGSGELRIVAAAGDSVSGATQPPSVEDRLNAVLEEQDRLAREVAALSTQLAEEQRSAADQLAVRDRQLEVKDREIAELQAQVAQMRERLAEPESRPQPSSATQQPWWQSPWVLLAALATVVLLVVYALVAARRRRAAADSFYATDVAVPDSAAAAAPGVAAGQPPAAAPMASAAAAPAAGMAAGSAAVAGAAAAGDATAVPPPVRPLERELPAATADEADGAETSDVIGEADIYIAYGRYPQAAGLLLGVLEEDADRNDVRLKLLELYAETGDAEAFDEHMAELLQRCSDEEALLTARDLAQQLEARPAPEAPADDEVTMESLPEEPHETPPSAALEVDPVAPASAADESFELELDDLLLDVEEDRPEHAAAGNGVDLDEGLGGDLGLDFLPEQNDAAVSASAEELQPAAAPRSRDDLPAAAGSNGSAADDGGVFGDLDDLEDLELGAEDGLDAGAFEFVDAVDINSTKLDLARAYIDMGDADGARDILKEVVSDGDEEQQQQAQALLEEL